jgi:FkbM family methyltransferase
MKGLPERLKSPIRIWMERIGLRPKRSFGLNQLDLKTIDHLNVRRGFFVEAGGNDGLKQSNTAYLEFYCGWHGLLIEPIPELARQCRANRPRAIVEQCALVAKDDPRAVLDMQYCGLMSLVTGARGTEKDDTAHINRGSEFLEEDEAPYHITVPARTLSSVLDAHGIERVDFLSLDVEGFESQVLRGLDFERHAPLYVLVEINNLGDVERALGDRYELIAILSAEPSHHDRLYRLRKTGYH